MSHRGQDGTGLWNEEDGFFYDVLRLPDGNHFPMKIRSMSPSTSFSSPSVRASTSIFDSGGGFSFSGPM